MAGLEVIGITLAIAFKIAQAARQATCHKEDCNALADQVQLFADILKTLQRREHPLDPQADALLRNINQHLSRAEDLIKQCVKQGC